MSNKRQTPNKQYCGRLRYVHNEQEKYRKTNIFGDHLTHLPTNKHIKQTIYKHLQ